MEGLIKQDWSREKNLASLFQEKGLSVSHRRIYLQFIRTNVKIVLFINTYVARKNGANFTVNKAARGPSLTIPALMNAPL